jgi:hypothetical protein
MSEEEDFSSQIEEYSSNLLQTLDEDHQEVNIPHYNQLK